MPSIQDVADQINAKLDQITTNTDQTADNTADTVAVANDIKTQLIQANARLTAIDANLASGFANLSQGLFAITELQKVEIVLLDHHRKQHDTMICLLENANELLCGITRKFTEQLRMSRESLQSTQRIEGMLERAHAAEAADYDRLQALNGKIERCCPPDTPPPERCPEPCEKPDFRPRNPEGQGWKPLPSPQTNPTPIG